MRIAPQDRRRATARRQRPRCVDRSRGRRIEEPRQYADGDSKQLESHSIVAIGVDLLVADAVAATATATGECAVAALAVIRAGDRAAPAGVTPGSEPLAAALTTGAVLTWTSVAPLVVRAAARRPAATGVAARTRATTGGAARTRCLCRIGEERGEGDRPGCRGDRAEEQGFRRASNERAAFDHRRQAFSAGKAAVVRGRCGRHRSASLLPDSHVVTSFPGRRSHWWYRS
jgi:hypothetical protein